MSPPRSWSTAACAVLAWLALTTPTSAAAQTKFTEDIVLLAQASGALNYLGGSVGLDGDTLVLGPYTRFTQKNTAYIFRKRADGTWVQEKQLNSHYATNCRY